MTTDVERWGRERLMEALESYKRGLSDAPYIRKWCSAHRESDFSSPDLRHAFGFTQDRHTTRVEAIPPVDRGPNGARADEMTFVVSTDEVDRHGDVISMRGWHLQAYKRNPVFLWAHDYTQPAIGRALNVWKEEHSLLARIGFAPTEFAQEVAALYRGGYQAGVSVGFRPLQYELRRDTRTGEVVGISFTEQELLEISAAPVPANQSALKKALLDTPKMQQYYHQSGVWQDDLTEEMKPGSAFRELLSALRSARQ